MTSTPLLLSLHRMHVYLIASVESKAIISIIITMTACLCFVGGLA